MWLYKCKCFDLAKYIIYYNRSIPRYTGSSVYRVYFYLHNMYITLFINKASSFIQTRVLYWLLISNLYRFPTMLDFLSCQIPGSTRLRRNTCVISQLITYRKQWPSGQQGENCGQSPPGCCPSSVYRMLNNQRQTSQQSKLD